MRAAEGATYADRILDAAARFREKPALRWKEGGAWRDMSYGEMLARVTSLALALRKRGIEPGDRVAIWLETSPAWVIADFATQIARAVTAPVYHTLPAAQAAAILRDAGAKALVTTARRLDSLAGENVLGTLVTIPIAADRDLEALIAEGAALAAARAPEWGERRAADLSAIIYTSGTTGEPKGAMLTHANFIANVDGAIRCFVPEGGHTALLHLPLAHVMARNVVVATMLLTGSVVAFAEPEREKVPANLIEIAPTAFMTVPYLLDKFMGRVLEAVRAKSGLGRALAERALALGRARRLAAIPAEGGPPRPRFPGLAFTVLDRLVLRKIRARLGGRLDFIVIGGSNSNRESVEFFWGLGIRVFEGYGATELTCNASFTWPGAVKLGTVGRAAPGVELRLADDGEVLVRGPNVMKGYWNRPEASGEAIDGEGWYHTGDVGAIDAQGYLRIVDRKKEIFALATGKKVAPQAVESALKASPLVLNACAVGDRRRFMTALLVPDTAVVAARLGLDAASAADDPRVREALRGEVERVMAPLAEFERVKRFRVIGEPFSQENDLLTPTLKLRRKRIAERYAREIEGLYEERQADVVSV
jgi:long-chain acyl-CoA synthetase